MDYWQQFVDNFQGYAHYVQTEVTTPRLGNYLYWLLAISATVYALELIAPWRRDQPKIRQDFWLDGFYMLFNFFLFNLVGYAALSGVAVQAFSDLLAEFDVENLVAIQVGAWPVWGQLLALLVIRDFIQWNVHRLLHRVNWLWQFHKVHHSILQMGFAGHLRYHWMENVVYRTLEYLPLAMIGFGIDDFLWVHLFTLTIGHLNHSNIVLPLGPLKFLFNNPQMHIWHHAKALPESHRYGINYGITLSVWDYLFKTAHIPHSGRDIELGFPDVEAFPRGFVQQAGYGFLRRNH